METRALGTSDLDVSVFGLGTMTSGAESDEDASHAIRNRYHEAGGRFIDTADGHSRGEEIIGRPHVRERTRYPDHLQGFLQDAGGVDVWQRLGTAR